MAESMSLAELSVGSSAVVVDVQAEGLMRRRLMDLGVVRGTKIDAIRSSPAGDPIVYGIRGTMIGLRSTEAKQILVRPLLS